MENRISELQAKSEILSHELDNILSAMDAAKAIENEKMSKWFQDLTGIAAVTVSTSSDKTIVGIPKPNGGWANEISIYHYEDYGGNKDRRFELSWFSSSATVKTDATTSNYLQYLAALGRIAEAFSNGSEIQNVIAESIAVIEPIRAKYRKISTEKAKLDSEIRTTIQEVEKAKLMGMISGPVAHLSVVKNHEYENRGKYTKMSETSVQCWDISARTTVFFDALTVIKGKSRWKVIFHELYWTKNENGEMVKNHYDLGQCKSKNMSEYEVLEILKHFNPVITKSEPVLA